LGINFFLIGWGLKWFWMKKDGMSLVQNAWEVVLNIGITVTNNYARQSTLYAIIAGY
jgi:hypothetical protein